MLLQDEGQARDADSGTTLAIKMPDMNCLIRKMLSSRCGVLNISQDRGQEWNEFKHIFLHVSRYTCRVGAHFGHSDDIVELGLRDA